jgi:formylglycine-generating enzyme required for sulfatase activity
MRAALLITTALLPAAALAAGEQAQLPAVEFSSTLPQGKDQAPIAIGSFRLDRDPVTNGEFLEFVNTHPKWRRDRVARLFADPQYLTHWQAPAELGAGVRPMQPVTRVSWFAAKAYCESRGESLPTWYQWEYAAAASETRADARGDPAWRQRILDWYAQPSTDALPDVAQGPANFYGVNDLHGLVWEWVLDYNALLVSNDSREQGGADRLRFCGEGALSAADRDNYAVLMRIAYLSALEANFTTANLGFRCATMSR